MRTAKDFPYEKLRGKSRPEHDGDWFSARHPKMDRARRAKQFLAFDALRGFDAAIDIAKDRTCLVEKRELDGYEAERVGKMIQRVCGIFFRNRAHCRCTSVSVTHFVPADAVSADADAGTVFGEYAVTKGGLTAVSREGGWLAAGGVKIMFDDISGITLL